MKISVMFIIVTAILMMTNPFVSGAQEEGSVIKKERHVSKASKYSIQFPDQWEVLKGVMGTDVIALAPTAGPEDLFRENVNIIYAKLDAVVDREDYYSFNIKSLSELLSDFDMEDTQDVELGGVQAKKIIFTHTMGVINVRVMQFLILEGRDAYVLTFTADPIDFEKMKPVFEEIAQSFHLEKEVI